jgi:hypothetical protein
MGMWSPVPSHGIPGFRTMNCIFLLRDCGISAEIARNISVFSFVGDSIIAYVG